MTTATRHTRNRRAGRREVSMPAYRFASDVLIPYMRETASDRKMTTQQREALKSKHLIAYFGEQLISHGRRNHIDGSVVRGYREMRKMTVQPSTVKTELALASKACNYAVSEWDYDMPNPFRGRLMSDRDRNAQARQEWHVLTKSEEARLLLACDPLTRDIVAFALATGFRQAEILGLTWDRVQGDLVRFTPDTQKAGRHSTRVLSDAALAVLARQPDGDYVFAKGGKRICRFHFHHIMWKPARTKSGLETFKFHWLRKTCGQRLLDATKSISIVQHQLGHAESRTTEQCYTQEPVDLMRQALKSVES